MGLGSHELWLNRKPFSLTSDLLLLGIAIAPNAQEPSYILQTPQIEAAVAFAALCNPVDPQSLCQIVNLPEADAPGSGPCNRMCCVM